MCLNCNLKLLLNKFIIFKVMVYDSFAYSSDNIQRTSRYLPINSFHHLYHQISNFSISSIVTFQALNRPPIQF